MKTAWLYDESIQAGTDFTDIKKVGEYDERMSRFRNYKQEAATALDLLGAGPDDTLLEIGTGTGHFAIEASRRCRKVCALDVSGTMLDYARQKAGRENALNIEWLQSGFLTAEFKGISFDHVFSNAALHHLPDFWKAVALYNIHKALKPGGKFLLGDVIFSCDVPAIERTVEEWVEGFKTIDEGFYSDSVMHVKKEYSTFSWIIEGMLERTGFSHRLISNSNNFMVYLCTRL